MFTTNFNSHNKISTNAEVHGNLSVDPKFEIQFLMCLRQVELQKLNIEQLESQKEFDRKKKEIDKHYNSRISALQSVHIGSVLRKGKKKSFSSQL